MIAVLQLADGTAVLLDEQGLEYWDFHILPYGAVILCDRRKK